MQMDQGHSVAAVAELVEHPTRYPNIVGSDATPKPKDLPGDLRCSKNTFYCVSPRIDRDCSAPAHPSCCKVVRLGDTSSPITRFNFALSRINEFLTH